MDKELLRLVIVVIGIVVIVWIILWGVLQNRRSKRLFNSCDEGNPLDNIDDSVVVKTKVDEFDTVSPDLAKDNDLEAQTNDGFVLPKIIQLSIIAKTDISFNGQQLADVFASVDLQYGTMNVFERLDKLNKVNYAVASLVEPGTFAQENIASYDFPGIVFFLQHEVLDDPLEIFDELLDTINRINKQLNGFLLDHNRQPLTIKTIKQFRLSLDR